MKAKGKDWVTYLAHSLLSKAKGKDWVPYLVYALLSLVILASLLLPGYILTLDMVPGPRMDFTASLYGLSEGTSSNIPLWLFLQGAGKIIPAWLLQKVILFLIFFLAGLGAHRLLPSRGLGNYFAGLLYVINPFTYIRFMAGQWTLLLAYALIPFAIKAFLDLLEEGSRRNIVKVTLLSTLVGIVAIHGLLLLFLAFLVIFLVKVVKERKRIVKAIKPVAISGGMFLVLNLYWIVPMLARGGITGHIGKQDLLVFAPLASSSFGVMFDVASLHGFWRLGYFYAEYVLPLWWLFFLFIVLLAIYGFICRFRDKGQGWIVISFAVLGIVSFFLAVGEASGVTRPLFEWLCRNVPFFSGFRDSQKFVALLCLSYAYLGGLGVTELAQKLKQQKKALIQIGIGTLVILALLTPATYSFPMFGFWGQLKATDYPEEWYEVNAYLNQDDEDFNVLFLPWHQYMSYNWLPNKTDKRLGNIAQEFFDKPVISGDNLEVPGIYSQSTNPISKYVEFLLRKGNDIDNFGELLAPLNVKYVILVHEADYFYYSFLYQQQDLAEDFAKGSVVLFKNEHPTNRVYSVDSVIYINDLEEYLGLSKTQDVTNHLYLLGGGTDETGSVGEELAFAQKSPVKYRVARTEKRWTIFTVPQQVSTEHWEYNGQQSLKNLGFMPAFEAQGDGGEVVYTKFYYTYLPFYMVSLLALPLLGWYYFSQKEKL